MFEDIERRLIYTNGRKVWELVVRIEKAMKNVKKHSVFNSRENQEL